MQTSPVKPAAPPLPGATPVSGTRETPIVVIPESYYAVAVKMQPPFASDEENKTNDQPAPLAKPLAPQPPPPPPPAPVVVLPAAPAHHSRLWLVGLIFFVLLAAAGGWVAWNRALLFGPKPVVVVAPEKPAAPNAPSDLAAVSSAPATVRLDWQDHSETEDGFRVERKTSGDVDYIALQTLPANSRTFLDQSAPAGSRINYRVVAFNPGGDSISAPTIEALVMDVPPVVVAPVGPALPPDGLDLDSDGLTDAEETLYGSNPQLPDTDADGYLDGNEVFNLYAATVRAPVTLLSLPIMHTVSSPLGWQTLAPKAWIVEMSSSTNDARLRLSTGETFLIRVESNPTKQDIRSWLMANKNLRSDQITELSSNKYKLRFYLGPDRFTAYIPWEDQVLSMNYQLGTQTFVNYRTSFGMLLNALRFTGSPNIPDLSQTTPIPSVFQSTNGSGPSATTSSSVVPVATTSSIFVPLPGTVSSSASSSSRP